MLRAVDPGSLLVRGLADNPSRGLSPALDRSTTFEREPGGTSPCGRGHAPVAAEAEALLGALEDADGTVFASGMTAWTAICLTVLAEGAALALPTSGYYSLENFATGILERFGVEVRRYDARVASDFRRACEGAALAIVETPSNPLLRLTDIATAARDAHAGGALLCCDSTFATPLLQRPLDLGADLAWQSATKYLAGHSDVLARRLAQDPGVRAVHYPGLPGHPDHEHARRQMPDGCGGVLAFELADGAAAERCEARVRLVRCATSLGGVETLIERRARVEPPGRVPEGLLRLSVGLEDVDDLWRDLGAAIAAAP
jgi:cystathionine gamma-synthase